MPPISPETPTATQRRKTAGALTVVVAFLLLAPFLATSDAFFEEPAPGARSVSENPDISEERNSSALATILGEFRTGMSDMIFIKTERYLHSGVAYMPHMDTHAMAQKGELTHKGDNEAPETVEDAAARFEQGITTEEMRETADLRAGQSFVAEGEDEGDHVATIVKTREDDYRGIIGDLERRVKPWRDPSLPHQHTAGTELLPWYRLATLNDPKNVRCYLIGAWWLKGMDDGQMVDEAERFVSEGIDNNPDSFQLYLMRCHIHRQKGQADEAYRDASRAATLAITQRPPDGHESPDWNNYKEDDAVAAITMAVMLERDTNGSPAAVDLIQNYEERLKGSMAVLQRYKAQLAITE